VTNTGTLRDAWLPSWDKYLYVWWSTQPGHPSVGKCTEYWWKLGLKQAHSKMH